MSLWISGLPGHSTFSSLQRRPSESQAAHRNLADRPEEQAEKDGPAARQRRGSRDERFRQRSACATQPPLSLGEPWCPSTAPPLLGRGCQIPTEPERNTGIIPLILKISSIKIILIEMFNSRAIKQTLTLFNLLWCLFLLALAEKDI